MPIVLEPWSAQTVGRQRQVIPPAAGAVFANRARRFEQLATGHALADWLRFLGCVARAQHLALAGLRGAPLPRGAELRRAREFAMPPVAARSWPRDRCWRQVLRRLAAELAPESPTAVCACLDALSGMPDDRLEKIAGQALGFEPCGDEPALLPFVAAALEVYWTAMAVGLGPELRPLDVATLCPCCGFAPVASVVRSDGDVAGLRYLHCPLCNTEWHLVGARCAVCEGTEGVVYRQIRQEGQKPAATVRAETCDSCRSYLKIVHRARDPQADPVADDLATLALDALVGELGYRRAGPSLLFVPGEET